MADYINKIRTTDGDKPVNYEALANKPNSLPNPNKIKFTGSVVAEYDGSSEVTVNIPNGASEEQAVQIQTNTNDISELKNKTSELKGDLVDHVKESQKAIEDLNDKKITKFYTNSLGEKTLNDSDNGLIVDMKLYGRSLQDGTPTPDKPVEIQSVVNPKLRVCGKNLLNVKGSIYNLAQENIKVNNYNDTINPNSDTKHFGFKIYLKKGTYTLSNQGSRYITINRITDDDGIIKGIFKRLYDNPYKFTRINDGYFYLGCEIDKSADDEEDVPLGNDTLDVFKLQLELGSTETDYEPYKEQSATLPYTLNAIPVSSGGNVTIDGQQYVADYVDVERGKLVRMVDKHDLGAVDWTSDVYDGNYYFYSVTSGFKSKQGYFDCLCSQYRYVSYHSVKYNDISLAVQNNNANQYIVLKNDIYTDASSLKSSLNGVYVYFILETPTEIDLTDEEVQAFRDLATYYPTTNVFVTSDQLDGYTEFNYPVSLAEGWNYVKQQLGDTRDYIYDMDLQSAEAYVNSEYAVTLAELEV